MAALMIIVDEGHCRFGWAGSLLSAVVLLILTGLFWKYRILDSGVNPTVEIGPVDLYIEHIPTAEYGFEVLRSGRVPLWNPYQFCGEPFLAVTYAALFYPPHLISLLVDVPTSVEILFVLHMFLGGLSMWWLARHLGIGNLGALTAALTFMWSGWMIMNNTLPTVFEALCWAPFTVLMIDWVLGGVKRAWMGLISALACQFLLGSMEVTLHTMYVGGLFTVCRLVQLSWGGSWIVALRRGGLILVCIMGAVLLASPQLLPTLELARQSTRAAGALAWEQAAEFWGSMPSKSFLRSAVSNTGAATVGVLPLLGLGLVLGFRRYQLVWVFGLIAALGGALLAFGGSVYHLYYEIPVVGSLFRRPMKFLDIYSFAQALLAGLAVERLHRWVDAGRREVCSHWGWLLSLAVGCAALMWLAWIGSTMNWYWAGMVGLLATFGVLSRPSLRAGILVGMCILQGANLFFTVGDTHVRPVRRPQIYHGYSMLLESLKVRLGDARVYLSPQFWFNPGLTAKQGMLRRMAVSIDYEPLAVERYQKFFDTVSVRTNPAPFAGAYELGPSSRWRLMDLTGSKFFVMNPGEPGEVFMKQNTTDFRFVYGKGQVRVFEKRQVLPRAYFVTRARTLAGPAEVLATLDSPTFDPRAEVLLEEAVESLPAGAAEPMARGEVRIASYEPERVVIAARVDTPGFLVLGDLFYPGWKAFVGDREIPIYQANYLFRAVRLDPGSAEVRFEYHPASFRRGVMLSAATAFVIVVACVWTSWRSVALIIGSGT